MDDIRKVVLCVLMFYDICRSEGLEIWLSEYLRIKKFGTLKMWKFWCPKIWETKSSIFQRYEHSKNQIFEYIRTWRSKNFLIQIQKYWFEDFKILKLESLDLESPKIRPLRDTVFIPSHQKQTFNSHQRITETSMHPK